MEMVRCGVHTPTQQPSHSTHDRKYNKYQCESNFHCFLSIFIARSFDTNDGSHDILVSAFTHSNRVFTQTHTSTNDTHIARTQAWKTNKVRLLTISMSLADVSRPKQSVDPPVDPIKEIQMVAMCLCRFERIPPTKLVFFVTLRIVRSSICHLMVCVFVSSGKRNKNKCHGNIDSIDTPNHTLWTCWLSDVGCATKGKHSGVRAHRMENARRSMYRFEIVSLKYSCTHYQDEQWVIQRRPIEDVCCMGAGCAPATDQHMDFIHVHIDRLEIPWRRVRQPASVSTKQAPIVALRQH